MKKIPFLLLAFILIISACKKEKNEPEPTTPSSLPQWMQDIDGREVEFTNLKFRNYLSHAFLTLTPKAGGDDTVVYSMPWDTTYSEIISETYMISFTNSSSVNLTTNTSSVSTYILTNTVDNPNYYVFTYDGSLSPNSQMNLFMSNPIIAGFYDHNIVENFVDKVHDSLRPVIQISDEFDVPALGTGHLYIPKNSNVPVVKTWGIMETAPVLFSSNEHFSVLNDFLHRNLPSSFYANYETSQAGYQNDIGHFYTGVIK